ncbi:MAG TPA: TetR/AcrR family transcriptional regulator [Acidimicrobiia bacterium]|nr:TetR/AcrR family transcriptional regulator [Acidimicrobiia bacterium]
MSTAYELAGRTQQKQRTRNALVDAARDLVARGLSPTVEDAAAAASISRTTAYRYFPNQRALLAAAHPETSAESLLPPDAPDDAAERLDLVVEAFMRVILDTESQQRTMLRLSLEADPNESGDLPLRQGRAIGWIEEALAPLRSRLGDAEVHRLALAVRSAAGIEALVWLTDIAGLSRTEAVELMRWSARAMYDAALAGPTSPGRTVITGVK